MSDSALPPAYEALLSDLLRALRHELNNRAHVLGLSRPLLQTIAKEAAEHLQRAGAPPANLGGVPLEEVPREVDWLLQQLDDRDEALARQVDALKRALLSEASATLATVVEDAAQLAANTLLKAGAEVVTTARGLRAPAPEDGHLLRGVCGLLLEVPPRSPGAITASVDETDGERALVLTLPSAGERWRPSVERARALIGAPIALALDEQAEPASVRFAWPQA